MRAWGASERVIEKWRKSITEQAKAQSFHVWPEHWHSLMVFRAMGTQWRVAAGGKGLYRLGLDLRAWPAVRRAFRHVRPKPSRAEQLRQLAVMETAALPLLNNR